MTYNNKKPRFMICILITTILLPLILYIFGFPCLMVRVFLNPHIDNGFIEAVPGIVVDYRETTGSLNLETYYYEIYECELNGHLYKIESKNRKIGENARDIGDSVELYYYPTTEEIKESDITAIFTGIGFIILLIATLSLFVIIPVDIILIILIVINRRKNNWDLHQ